MMYIKKKEKKKEEKLKRKPTHKAVLALHI